MSVRHGPRTDGDLMAHHPPPQRAHALGCHREAPVLSGVQDLNPQDKRGFQPDHRAQARRLTTRPYRESGLVLVPGDDIARAVQTHPLGMEPLTDQLSLSG